MNDHWIPEKNRIIDSYLPARTQIVLDQLNAAGLWPGISAPVFSQSGGHVTADFRLMITADKGTIYYTLNGTDPRLTGGSVNPTANTYLNSLEINQKSEVKARTKLGDTWSALTAATFYPENYQSGPFIPADVSEKMTVYPNPFSDYTNMKYHLPESGNVILTLYHVDGRHVEKRDFGFQERGIHTYTYMPVYRGPGIFILQLSCGKFLIRKKVVIK